ncbi:MAG: hypothetical protein RL030_920, partial [Pseudomonadota bacterium]
WMGIVWKLQPVPARVLEEGRAKRPQRAPVPALAPTITPDGVQA